MVWISRHGILRHWYDILIHSVTRFGEEVAGCKPYSCDGQNGSSSSMDDECDGEVWGFLKPSPPVSSARKFLALGSALFLLLVGAVIEDTDYRHQIREYLMYGLIVLGRYMRLERVYWSFFEKLVGGSFMI